MCNFIDFHLWPWPWRFFKIPFNTGNTKREKKYIVKIFQTISLQKFLKLWFNNLTSKQCKTTYLIQNSQTTSKMHHKIIRSLIIFFKHNTYLISRTKIVKRKVFRSDFSNWQNLLLEHVLSRESSRSTGGFLCRYSTFMKWTERHVSLPKEYKPFFTPRDITLCFYRKRVEFRMTKKLFSKSSTVCLGGPQRREWVCRKKISQPRLSELRLHGRVHWISLIKTETFSFRRVKKYAKNEKLRIFSLQMQPSYKYES